jgi:glycosyltransferase involved in cell wall biosynthesis
MKKNMFISAIFLAGVFSCLYFFLGKKLDMVLVVPSYNNIRYYERNLDSLISQNYKNYRIIYVDDNSSDGMSDKIVNYLKDKKVDFKAVEFTYDESISIEDNTQKFGDLVNSESHFFTYVHNKKRTGALANIYRAVHSAKDNEVMVLVDGDDWFPDRKVLKRLNNVYTGRKEVWLTHGRLKEYPNNSKAWCKPVPEELIMSNRFREFRCPSHLRTFYAWLFKKIKLEDLLFENNFMQMAWDMALMYPMIEMAGHRHQFITKVNYIYNVENVINDNKVNPELQNRLDVYIRSLEKYEPLNERN